MTQKRNGANVGAVLKTGIRVGGNKTPERKPYGAEDDLDDLTLNDRPKKSKQLRR